MSLTNTALIAEFDKVVTVAYGKKTLEYNPALAGLVASYKVPFAPTSSAIFKNFIAGLAQVTDGTSIDASTLPEHYKVDITNNKYGQKVQVTESEFERASSVADLAIYVSEIESLAVNAKDDPILRGLQLLEAGHTNANGVCFDGKNFFATDHLYGTATGQSNLLSGHGNTLDQVSRDMDAAYNAMTGFYANAGGGKKLLNKTIKILVICSTQLASVFKDLRDKKTINATDNAWAGNFEFAVNPSSDPYSWYMLNLENDSYLLNRAILNPIEKEAKLKNNLAHESAQLDGLYKWQVDMRQGIAYGAWYKAVKVDNSGAPVTAYYTVNAMVVNGNGTISPVGFLTAVNGSSIEFTLTPAAGYVVDKLFVNGTDVTANIVAGKYTLANIAANKSVVATFKTEA